MGLDSAVGIMIRYGLDYPGPNPGGDEVIRTRPDRLWGQPSLLYKGYQTCFQGVKQPGHGVEHQSPSSAEVKERVELYLNSPLGLRGLFQGEPYLYLYFLPCKEIGS